MNFKKLLIIVLLFCANSLLAQNIIGKINNQSGSAVKNAEIKILNSDKTIVESMGGMYDSMLLPFVKETDKK